MWVALRFLILLCCFFCFCCIWFFCFCRRRLRRRHRSSQNFFFLGGWGYGWIWVYKYYIYYMILKILLWKIMLPFPSRHLVKIQNKWKKNLHIHKFLLRFAIFQCNICQPIAVAHLGWSVNRVKYLISSCLQNLFFFLNFPLFAIIPTLGPPFLLFNGCGWFFIQG